MTEQAAERCRKNRDFLEWMDAILLSVALIALAFTFCARAVRVDGSSMVPTLHNGELLLTVSFGYTSERGDIVVVDSYIPHGRPLVKRVIGVAGDVIDIDFANGIVTRNGDILEEPYIAELTTMYEGMDFPLTVPEGTVFLMGDNRNHSKDSRDPEIGCVDVRDILGTPKLRISPFSAFGVLE